ncbi:hypothetical protein ACOSQ3_023440 [Xanthoceras sorbifolium]
MSRRVSLAKVLGEASTMDRVAVSGGLRNWDFVKRIAASKVVIAEDEQKSVIDEGPEWGKYHGQSGDQRRTQKLGFCQENCRKQEAVIAEDEHKSVVGEGSGWGEYHGQSGGQRRTQKLGFCQENRRKQDLQDSIERNPRLGVLLVVLRDAFPLFLFFIFLFGNGFADLLEGDFGGYK